MLPQSRVKLIAYLAHLAACKLGRHDDVEWAEQKGDDWLRCRHCLRWAAGAPPR